VLYDTIELRSGRTLSVQFGAWPMLLFGGVSLAVIWARRRFLDLDPQGHGPVVDQLDGHVGAEATGSDVGTRRP